MNRHERLVLDTNVLVSAALHFGLPHQVLLKARGDGILLASEATLAELHEVLLRSKFDTYIEHAIREGIVEEYARNCTVISIASPIRICRDPRDDKFLEVAVHGRADAIVTGDRDLLALHPFLGIEILTPADYLKKK
jgi:putative PIN family toxin of toxin-antitoxin system